ncbi:MAG: bifunctional methylenetetrahydrofolate dehydrogenase/methenyltetrahydrofolate cyclohydrolase FolD [Candidatus Hydrogenedentes bacterium]|nr:bifunctional methylenetetrahydrofolate dehydrogenase/methenyltetrahydrofolate cyclohydrolase FolD [Candidatus Hydrogenedentota bacterium]
MAPAKSAALISGKELSEAIVREVGEEVASLKSKDIHPGLAVVLVGSDPASQVYVRNKRRTCDALGIRSFAFDLPENCTEKRLLTLVTKLNADPAVNGILVQVPLPKHINEQKVLNAIDPIKDVDGFHPMNVGKLLNGEPSFVPCTPAGCQEMLMRSGNDPAGKHVVVLGRSNIVGKPIAALLMQKGKGGDATVTVCHSRTQNLEAITKQADILIAAIGIPLFVKANMVKSGVVVIDVGINRIPDASKASGTRLVGDVDFDTVSKKAKAITPVPGGVGLMTIAMLMKNTVRAVKLQRRMKL